MSVCHTETMDEHRKETVLPFKTPSNVIIAAMTGAGKTFLVYQILQNAPAMFEVPPRAIMYCYNVYQTPLFDQMKREIDNIHFHENIPDRETLQDWNKTYPQTKIIVLDDLLQRASTSNDIVDLFCVLSSHMNYTVFFLIQNVFGDSKRLRTISLNTHYFIIFKNSRHEMQVQILGRQLYPRSSDFFMSACKKAIIRDYGYLVIDIHPRSNPLYALRTNILPGETTIVYRPMK